MSKIFMFLVGLVSVLGFSGSVFAEGEKAEAAASPAEQKKEMKKKEGEKEVEEEKEDKE